jgi:ornithine cyclodeaminase/alanine dehydrogenase-like protein (mu-crystallin family)
VSVAIIGPDVEARLDWLGLCDAIEAGHARSRAEIADSFLYRGTDTLLSRAAWIDGLGQLVKTATIFPGNAAVGKPAVNGSAALYSDTDGTLAAIVDFHLLTKWKTAGDSLCAARLLARKDSAVILIVGAGTVAASLRAAYGALFPDARFLVWNRTRAGAERLAARFAGTTVADDLPAAVAGADIVTCATMATDPVLRGEWLRPGQHVDLIGAYRPDMREADDAALRRARIFVDSRATTIGHIGELKIPLARGVISQGDVLADYYDLPSGAFARRSDDEITLFKNGGGAHLDLMTARYVLDRVGG